MGDSVAQDMIASYFDRWQRLEEEKAAISGDLKELFAEAKANGFDTKVLRVVFRDKVADQNAKSEFEAIYDLYWSALGTPRATGARPAQAIPEHDADGVVRAAESPRFESVHGAREAHRPATYGQLVTAGETATYPSASRNGIDGTSEGQGATGAGTGGATPPAGANSTRRMSMTPLEPREADGLKGFGFTVRFDEGAAQ